MTWRADYAKETYHDGKQAFRDGVTENPHPWGCLGFHPWNCGYDAAQDQEHQIASLHTLHPQVRRPRQIDRVLEGAA